MLAALVLGRVPEVTIGYDIPAGEAPPRSVDEL
jgi:hypothetical protein